jgi:hypothetical protein
MQAMTFSDWWAAYARALVETTALIFAFALSTAHVLSCGETAINRELYI